MTEKRLFHPHGIKDNHTRGKVADFLEARLRQGSRLSVVSAYFTIYAYEALRKQLDGIESLQFLFGEPRFMQSLDPAKNDKKAFNIEDEGLSLANRLRQKEVARRCAEWISSKAEIRSTRQANRRSTSSECCAKTKLNPMPTCESGLTLKRATGKT